MASASSPLSKASSFPATTGCPHGLVAAGAQPAGDPGHHLVAGHLHLYPELLQRADRHQPGADVCRPRQLPGDAQGPDLLGDDLAHAVLHRGLRGAGAGAGAGDRATDPLAALGLAVPAPQPDHPVGGADHRQRRDVALDLQRRLRRPERPADAAGADQALRPLADLHRAWP